MASGGKARNDVSCGIAQTLVFDVFRVFVTDGDLTERVRLAAPNSQTQ